MMDSLTTLKIVLVVAGTLGLSLAALTLVMMFRNNCVLNARLAVLDCDDGMTLFESLPSYQDMLYRRKYWGLWTVESWKDWLRAKGHTVYAKRSA